VLILCSKLVGKSGLVGGSSTILYDIVFQPVSLEQNPLERLDCSWNLMERHCSLHWSSPNEQKHQLPIFNHAQKNIEWYRCICNSL